MISCVGRLGAQATVSSNPAAPPEPNSPVSGPTRPQFGGSAVSLGLDLPTAAFLRVFSSPTQPGMQPQTQKPPWTLPLSAPSLKGAAPLLVPSLR